MSERNRYYYKKAMRTIFNTSFIIDENIEKEWISFMREHYIAPLKENQLCNDIIFTKVSIDQPEGKTYSLQAIFDSEQQQNHFIENWLPLIENKIIRKYHNRYICFSSTLTEI